MRWREFDGTERVRSGFLLLPKSIRREWRWLEYARWQERYITGIRTCAWIATEWLN